MKHVKECFLSLAAIVCGVLLSILGVVVYGLTNAVSATALIPSFIGIVLIVLGFVARNDKARMHAMHLGALLALIGVAGGVFMGIKALLSDRPATVWGESLGMAILCGVFLVLCIRSFIAARQARKQKDM